MANYNRDWDRGRNSSGNQWSDDRYDQYRYEDDMRNENNRNRESFDRREMRGLNQDQGKEWGRNNGYGNSGMGNDDKYRGDNDSNYNRGVYGNSTGVSRGSSNYLSGRGDSGRNYNSNRGMSEGRRGYSGSDYGDQYNRQDDRDWWDKTKDEVSSWFGDDDAARRRNRDERRESHRGRGPKGYTRSDDRIKEDVNDRLMDDDHIDASDIDISVDNCEVVLTGHVKSRFEKRHAEDIVESVSGVKNVENRLRVKDNGYSNNFNDTSRSSGSNFGASGASPVGAFDTSKPGE